MRTLTFRPLLAAGAAVVAISCSNGSSAQPGTHHRFDIPSQYLKYALRTATREAGLRLLADADDLNGRRSPELHAATTIEAALAELLAGTGLHAEIVGRAVFIRGRSPAAAVSESPGEPEILVTGTRIKGAPPSYPVTSVSQDMMRSEGMNDLGDVIRSLPQNFGGGQNPGVGFGIPGSENVTSGSSLDLRGLGPDATLTLLNGHRIAYDSANQSIDVSAIPIAALERIDIVADGASALYGSDAVGGVANIILRRDYQGLDTRIRIGSTTDGGGFQREYSAVAGGRWNSGGVMITGDISQTSAILAGDRSITEAVPADTILNPRQQVEGAVLAGHQRLSETLEFSIDGFYNHRTSFTSSTYAPPNVLTYGSTFHTDLTSYEIAPKLTARIGPSWHVDLQAVHGSDKVKTDTIFYYGGAAIEDAAVDFANRLNSIEASSEGAIVALPGGSVRLALGGGYRAVSLRGTSRVAVGDTVLSDTAFRGHRHTSYAYGELFVPIVGAGNARAGVHRLDLTAAGRLEHDPEYGSVFTPKIGIAYDPSSDFGFSASWGRSFKEPALNQLGTPESAALAPASEFAAGYPSTSTVLVRNGGNPNLRPERARTWSATLQIHPTVLPDVHVAASYFDVHYTNRIVTPLADENGALTNPLYAGLVTLAPSPGEAAALVSGLSGQFTNNAGMPFDPAAVIAIFDNRYHNLSSFDAHGVDLAWSITMHLPGGSSLEPNGAISYLRSSQINLRGGATTPRAGTLYNPPHWRARLTIPWRTSDLTVTPAMTIAGGLSDPASGSRYRGMTTFDLTLRYQTPLQGRLAGLDVSVSIVNLANRRPPRIPVPDPIYPPFDSANYQAIGRYVGISVGKHW